MNPAGTSDDETLSFDYNPASEIVSRHSSNAAYDWGAPSPFTDNYTANGLNQLLTAGGASVIHDDRGNITNDGTQTYSYDADNKLLSAGSDDLSYDAAGRLVEEAGTSTTQFLYDGADVIAEYDASGAVHGPGADEPLVWYEGSGTSDRVRLCRSGPIPISRPSP